MRSVGIHYMELKDVYYYVCIWYCIKSVVNPLHGVESGRTPRRVRWRGGVRNPLHGVESLFTV